MQRRAVLHGEGPLLILAGAGSGKTRTLTHRVAHLIGERAVEARRILSVTFTNKAAAEMRERLQRLLGTSPLPWMSTFHAACVRILRLEIGVLGFTPDFVIYDDRDQERLIKDCLSELSIPERTLTVRPTCALIDTAKNSGVSPATYDRSDAWREAVARVYERYQTKLQRANALDFGDLLLTTVRLFEQHPAILDRYRSRFQHVLVDEYQDTNSVQYRLTNLLASAHRNLCVVGDDDQSIYRWRGAEIGNILDFERDYPDTVVIRLEQNYRSSGNILTVAGAVVSCNTQRRGKTLWTHNPRGDTVSVVRLNDDLEEAQFVAAEINRLRHTGIAHREIAVFYRTNAQSRSFEEALVRHRIPYLMVGGIRFFSRAEIKDILAYLRVLVNPADSLSAKRIINAPPRGIGVVTVQRITPLEEEAGGFFPACRLAIQRGLLKRTVADKVQAFVGLMDSFHDRLEHTPYPQLTAQLIEETGYGSTLRDDSSSEARERLQNLDELLTGMEEHVSSEQTLQDYLAQVVLVADVDSYDGVADRVTLMTLHTAKGLEFPTVFMTGMEEGLFPHARVTETDIEEERRLCYVGMTRAMKRLVLTHAERRRVYGDFKTNARSRFIDEIPETLLDLVGVPARRRDEPHRFRQRHEHKIDDAESVRVVYESEDGLRIGGRVRHDAFGVGTIKHLEGAGERRKVTVDFRAVGVKKLLLKYASLEPA